MSGVDESKNVDTNENVENQDIVTQQSEQSQDIPRRPGMARQTGLNPGEEGRPVSPESGEAPAPIPAQNSPVQRQPEGEWVFYPRTDAREVQPAPLVTFRSVAEPVEAEPLEAVKTAPAARVAPVPIGGLTELARVVYGDENRAVDIFNANRDIMTSPDAHTIGHTTVRLPD